MRAELVFLVLVSSAFAQQAELSGLIQDPSGAVVPNAEVSIRNEQTGAKRSTLSNTVGLYSLPSLRPGIYKITVSATGFKITTREDLKLEVSQNGQLDFTLRLEEVKEDLIVKAFPQVVNPSDPSVGTLIDKLLIDKIPNNGRQLQMLIGLTPGVSFTPVNPYSLGQFVTNGQRPNANYFTVDGISANFGTAAAPNFYFLRNAYMLESGPLQPLNGSIPVTSIFGTFNNLATMDEIQEFRIQTSSASVDAGRMPGAQLSISTRSGTNVFSGSFYQNLRNDNLAAADWFHNKEAFHFNNFGGSIGGPVRLRKHADSSSFFFASIEEVHLAEPQAPRLNMVPSLEARQGAPSATRPLLEMFPLPNGGKPQYFDGIGLATVTTRFSNPSSLVTGTTRFDHFFGSRLHLFGRYSQSTSTVEDRSRVNPANLVTDSNHTELGIIGFTQLFGSSKSNDIRLGVGKQMGIETMSIDTFGGAVRPPKVFELGASQDSLIVYALGSSQTEAGLGRVMLNTVQQFQVTDTFSVMMGTSQLKFGVDYRRVASMFAAPRLHVYASAEIEGEESIYTGVASDLYATSNPIHAFLTPAFSMFAQDTWHAKPRLTFTYGVRWDVNPAPRSNNAVGIPTFSLGDPYLSVVMTREPLYSTQFHKLAPRIGVSWRLMERPRFTTLLRAGAGIFYDLGQDGFANMDLPPGGSSRSSSIGLPLQGSLISQLSLDSGTSMPRVALTASPGLDLPKTYEWNLSLQQFFGNNQSLSAAYVGAAGKGLLGQGDLLNNGSLGPFEYNPDIYALRSRIVVGNIGSSAYNALQLQFNRRLSSGIQALVSYSWSHSIDDVPNVTGSINGSQWKLVQPYQVFLHPKMHRGSSDFDMRHGITGAWVWNLPNLKDGRRWVRSVMGGWSIQAIGFAHSAPPSNLATGNRRVGDDTYWFDPRRPDLVPGVALYLYGSGYPGGKRINPAAFGFPNLALLEGTLGRNVLRLFGAWQADFALHRNWRLGDRWKVDFRGECFNVFNHPNFANPTDLDNQMGNGIATSTLANGLSNASSFGGLQTLFQIGGARSAQLGLRLSF